jgi:hypothetical protein
VIKELVLVWDAMLINSSSRILSGVALLSVLVSLKVLDVIRLLLVQTQIFNLMDLEL